MVSDDLNSRRVTLMALAGGGISLAAAVLSANPIALVPASLFFASSLVLWKYGYLLVPALLSRMNIVEVRENFEIPPSRDMVLKRSGGRHYASIFLSAKITDSVSEKGQAERAMFMEYFERALSSVKCVAKYSVLVKNLDMTNVLDEIKTKRGLAETKRARLLSSGNAGHLAEISVLEREIAMWNRQLERLTAGERPMEVLAYIMTTAAGTGRDEAVSKARAQASEISSVVGNALNLEVEQLKGEAMLGCFEWEKTLPADGSEFDDVAY